MDEKYASSPFRIEYSMKDHEWLDSPINVNFTDNSTFTFSPENENPSVPQKTGDWIENEHIRFRILAEENDFDLTSEDFVFIINSNESLQNYLEQNILLILYVMQIQKAVLLQQKRCLEL